MVLSGDELEEREVNREYFGYNHGLIVSLHKRPPLYPPQLLPLASVEKHFANAKWPRSLHRYTVMRYAKARHKVGIWEETPVKSSLDRLSVS